MAVRNDFTAGEVLAAADLNDTFASKLPYSYGTATPSTTVDGFLWYDDNDTPPTPKFWDGAAFQNVAAAGGLELITSESFSAVSSVSVDNCFSSSYKNYHLVISYTNSTTADTGVRLRASGTDSSSSYFTRLALFQSVYGTSTITTQIRLGGGTSTERAIAAVILGNVFETTSTAISASGNDAAGNSGYVTNGVHTASTSYDGFSLITSSGTITGNVNVYGYKD